jgi:hypothetical protein
VLDALRYAMGYEAYSHTAVKRIARVRRLSVAGGAVQAALRSPDGDEPSVITGSEAGQEPPFEDSRQRSLDQYTALLRDKVRTTTTREDEDGE